jgi:hypothetical protein
VNKESNVKRASVFSSQRNAALWHSSALELGSRLVAADYFVIPVVATHATI